MRCFAFINLYLLSQLVFSTKLQNIKQSLVDQLVSLTLWSLLKFVWFFIVLNVFFNLSKTFTLTKLRDIIIHLKKRNLTFLLKKKTYILKKFVPPKYYKSINFSFSIPPSYLFNCLCLIVETISSNFPSLSPKTIFGVRQAIESRLLFQGCIFMNYWAHSLVEPYKRKASRYII